MLIAAVIIKTRPNHREEFAQAALRLSEQARTEPGCKIYRFSTDLADPNTFYVYEEWESDEAMQLHFKTPGFLAIQEKLPAMVAEPISIRTFQATEVPGA
jgi:quinol monooxygenase YgiN